MFFSHIAYITHTNFDHTHLEPGHTHIQVLQKKFDDFQREISASKERYSVVNSLARKLVAEGHSDTVLIKEKQDAVR